MKNERLDRELDQVFKVGNKKHGEIKASPFFTTRVMGKVEQLDDVRAGISILSYIIRPAFALFILINVANFYFFNNSDSDMSLDESIEDAGSEYIYASNDFMYSEDLLTGNYEVK
ncbi:hypothetical protein [Plebeiibacterium marinum]|uniref:Uncharacterized protein n=1 Tax=Plebeiibacterium marinum TaxID=2992111 RepID=A0AAE3MEV0_9BACT|nr:hypothetical protein [Plebeiobacterium marinum]MCW3806234.1 hypothetical protein [Plebeiobacterium marinum]